MDHQGDFQVLVEDRRKAGALPPRFEKIEIDFKASRVLCIAGDFTKFDVHAVQQINRNLELIRYVRFGEDLLSLELINGEELSQPTPEASAPPPPGIDALPGQEGGAHTATTVSQYMASAPQELIALYEALREHLLGIAEDVKEKVNLDYIAFRRLKNFACVEVHPQTKRILVFLKVDPAVLALEKDFSRDVRKIGHFGTGDLELSLRSMEDLEKAKSLIQQSYDAS